MNFLYEITQLIAWALILLGSVMVIIGALGSLRFPDFWSRLHAASVTDSGGVILLLLGMGIHSGFNLITFKLFLIGAFLFITGPTSSTYTFKVLLPNVNPTLVQTLAPIFTPSILA